MNTLSPVFTGAVSLVFAANDHYAPYLYTLIASILKQRDSQRPYDLIVLSEDFSPQNQAIYKELCDDRTSVRFLDVTEALRPFQDKLRVRGHFRVETYFRLLLPQLLPDHHKVLYLDADMVCLHNVAELYDTDMRGYLVAACKDPDTTGLYNGSTFDDGHVRTLEYMHEQLGVKDLFAYFQAGTVLFNLDEWRTSINVAEVFEFAQSNEWHLLDQDVLNHFCYGHVRFLDMSWNVMYDFDRVRIRDIIAYSSPELQKAYMAARAQPRIIHYAGPTKPWDDLEVDFAHVFWRFARQTPYYEIMLMRRYQKLVSEQLVPLEQHLNVIDEYAHRIDAELLRYEHRSVGLMAKEFIYQKLLTPLARIVTGEEDGIEHIKARRR